MTVSAILGYIYFFFICSGKKNTDCFIFSCVVSHFIYAYLFELCIKTHIAGMFCACSREKKKKTDGNRKKIYLHFVQVSRRMLKITM